MLICATSSRPGSGPAFSRKATEPEPACFTMLVASSLAVIPTAQIEASSNPASRAISLHRCMQASESSELAIVIVSWIRVRAGALIPQSRENLMTTHVASSWSFP